MTASRVCPPSFLGSNTQLVLEKDIWGKVRLFGCGGFCFGGDVVGGRWFRNSLPFSTPAFTKADETPRPKPRKQDL